MSSVSPTLTRPEETRALVITRVPAPWWAPSFLITRGFLRSIPEYAKIPSLVHKAYTLSDDRRFGGLYLWRSRAAAERFFDASWFAGVRERRGVEGEARIFDVCWTVDGEAPPGSALPPHGLRVRGAVVWLSAPGGADTELRALAAMHGLPPGLVRLSLVTEPSGTTGAIALWSSRVRAEAFWTAERRAAAAKGMGAEVTLTWFSAPVLLVGAGASS